MPREGTGEKQGKTRTLECACVVCILFISTMHTHGSEQKGFTVAPSQGLEL